jgi:hypothetical protein
VPNVSKEFANVVEPLETVEGEFQDDTDDDIDCPFFWEEDSGE